MGLGDQSTKNSPGGVSILDVRYKSNSSRTWWLIHLKQLIFINNDLVTTTRNCSGVFSMGNYNHFLKESTKLQVDANMDGYEDVWLANRN